MRASAAHREREPSQPRNLTPQKSVAHQYSLHQQHSTATKRQQSYRRRLGLEDSHASDPSHSHLDWVPGSRAPKEKGDEGGGGLRGCACPLMELRTLTAMRLKSAIDFQTLQALPSLNPAGDARNVTVHADIKGGGPLEFRSQEEDSRRDDADPRKTESSGTHLAL